LFTFPKKYLSVTDGMSTPVVRGCGASAGVHTCDVCVMGRLCGSMLRHRRGRVLEMGSVHVMILVLVLVY
jgi:hypothetical protein